MANSTPSNLAPLSPEKRRVVAGQFERASQVIASGNLDYGIQLLLKCCELDPGSLPYRQFLRQTEKNKYKNNRRGSSLAFLTTFFKRIRMTAARRKGNLLAVLHYGEMVLYHNPWDVGAQLAMGEAFEGLGLLDHAVWTLDQARQSEGQNLRVNRALAKLCEKRGNFTQAIALWEIVRKANPSDVEAQTKAKDLAASDTIAKGQYDKVISGGPDAPLPTNQKGKAPAVPVGESPPLAAASPLAHEERHGKEAAALLAKIQADPTNVNAYLHLAHFYRRADQFEQAREVLMEGLGPTGKNFDVALELADLEIELYRRDLAITEEKLKRQPNQPELHTLRQRLLNEINARELDFFRQKADRYPTEMAHRFEVGVRLLRAGQYDEAIRELQAARSDPRHHGRALMYLGFCFKHRNNWRLAQRNFEEALQHLAADDPQRKEIMFQLAQGCAEAGEWARAVEFGCDLANLDFTYRDIGRLLDEWQSRTQKT